ncbi:hypothetical protein FE257_008595 [Aspergillus nanangensis]|uniref:NlpC/P60 domain-containing protein n=1 Tax=Aspergillus nanangensis TaxID=2582783 RepID=A0AAD4CLK7_ASPNN|nr:hypothetical protein FE257_008595 [Aspergillus nanangensis]
MRSLSLLAISAIGTVSTVAATTYPITTDGVNCRSGAGTKYDSITKYAKDTEVNITCQLPGESISGNSLWDKTSDDCYVTDYYVKTGTTGYVADKCSTGGDNGNSTGSGADIVAAAEEEIGLPYVYGGGGCKGPTQGGFDCSGLTQFAICEALDFEIPRVAQDQYDSPLGTRLARSEAKEGDLLFWASGGKCGGSITHVGIFIKDGLMVNAAKTGTPVREQEIWTSYGGIEICPEVMRFW